MNSDLKTSMTIKSSIAETIIENISNEHAFFVFPTGVAADAWADWTIIHEELTQVRAVAMERFIAWDDFKSSSIKSRFPDLKSIPSVLRTIFAHRIIKENAQKPFFKQLIPAEYAHTVDSFAPWIASLLPSLADWKRRFTAANKEGDDEDDDLMILYTRYASFLHDHALFDPAWEIPPFTPDGNSYYLFYPEVLMDFKEYQTLLTDETAAKYIHLVSLGSCTEQEKGTVHFYSNSRTELRKLCLNLRNLHKEKNIEWSDIAVSINDIETYAPYLIRDFRLYQIPAVLRNGTALAMTGTGSFFPQLLTCIQESFSFDSIRALVKNNHIPWKREYDENGAEIDLGTNLVEFGIHNNCLTSFERNGKKIDSWQESFNIHQEEHRLELFYNTLRNQILSLGNAKSFTEIRKKYFSFKAAFFDMNRTIPSDDRIMSRCISELTELTDVETNFPDCPCPNPFSFFVDVLKNTVYLAQTDTQGVQIFPYKLASTAPFACHVVIDASQASCSILFKRLAFLREDKRSALGIEDVNPSEAFLRLYTINSSVCSLFSSAEKTFTGYALPHSFLIEDDNRQQDFKEPNDFFPAEADFINGTASSLPPFITQIQKNGFIRWSERTMQTDFHFLPPHNDVLLSNLAGQVYKEGKLRISETALKDFFTCPRRWLYRSGLKIEETENEAELMDRFALGDIYHSILYFFLSAIKEHRGILGVSDGQLSDEFHLLLEESIQKAVISYPASPIAKELLLTIKTAVRDYIENAVTGFCLWFSGYSVAAAEQAYTVNPENKNYFLYGRVDCLLRSPTGKIVLIDFKTNKGPPKRTWYFSDTTPIPDFQMPMYLTLLQNQDVPITVDSAAFFSLKDAKPFIVCGEVIDPNGKSIAGEDMEATMSAFTPLIEHFADHIKNGDFNLPPTVSYETCSSCPYKTLCRRTFTVCGEQTADV